MMWKKHVICLAYLLLCLTAMDDVCFQWHREISTLAVSKHNYNFNMKHFYLRSSFSKGKIGKTGYF
jgi:hypothetical protein